MGGFKLGTLTAVHPDPLTLKTLNPETSNWAGQHMGEPIFLSSPKNMAQLYPGGGGGTWFISFTSPLESWVI